MPAKSHLLLGGLLLWVWVVPQVKGQVPLTAAEGEKVERVLERDHSGAPLQCFIQPQAPLLDFAFHFDVGYIISCPLRVFGGRATAILAFTRVTPEGGKPMFLGESYRLPGISPEQAAATANSKLKGRAEASGGFTVGEGRYDVDALLIDQGTGQRYRKHWRVHVARRRSQRAVPVAVPPATVLPLAFQPWQGKLDTSGKGLRLAIWLNAAPMNPRAQKLRAWDRAASLFLLSTLLGQIPCASVRLIAFNLDQQREVFRQEDFDGAGFMKLQEALRTLELGTVSYRVLQQRSGWLDMLADLANREMTTRDPSDVVLILGPPVRYYAGIPRETLRARETPNPRFCYFQYFPGYRRSPDTLHQLTKRLGGTVYEIYSAADLARAIQKMLAQARPSRNSAEQRRWSERDAPTQ
jgi:hypothetical protein